MKQQWTGGGVGGGGEERLKCSLPACKSTLLRKNEWFLFNSTYFCQDCRVKMDVVTSKLMYGGTFEL